MHFATCDATLEQWGGNSANDAVWWPTGCPAMDHVDIPSLSNKINAAQQLTRRNADGPIRSELTPKPLQDMVKMGGGGGHNRSFSKVYYISCLHTFLSEVLGEKKPKNSHVDAKNVLCDLDF